MRLPHNASKGRCVRVARGANRQKETPHGMLLAWNCSRNVGKPNARNGPRVCVSVCARAKNSRRGFSGCAPKKRKISCSAKVAKTRKGKPSRLLLRCSLFPQQVRLCPSRRL